MGHSATPSPRPRLIPAGVAYVCSFYLLLGLMTIFELRMRGSPWRGSEIINWGIGVTAIALVIVGISLLILISLSCLPARSKWSFSAQTSRCPGVWDQEIDR